MPAVPAHVELPAVLVFSAGPVQACFSECRLGGKAVWVTRVCVASQSLGGPCTPATDHGLGNTQAHVQAQHVLSDHRKRVA